ncbi:tRNA/rRNA methyltransferase SpoU [Penicillium taxi]|uniref:tRNA/rRNA methyltransferase SpoU n=1 Tax=Penicillium taxi TaxID=168475 RepID=UPI0025456ABD|nr:tRNA/rRNA methyltransferase SpoU [Penicillium taxi]KAJ5898914.1 tRNA/rRNA methyltransferase SpoU [Penicillium taxi]
MERRSKGDFDADEFVRSGKFQGLPRSHQAHAESRWDREERYPRLARQDDSKALKPRAHRITDSMPERVKDNVKVPDSVPYTTPASEFIYGTGAVEAALRCSRRQLYKLYLYQATGEELSPTKVSLRKLALSKNIEIKLAFAGWDRLLDKMSSSRPHNGCVLEASPLPKLPVQCFHTVPAVTESHFRVELAPQSREEAAINGTNDRIQILQPHLSEIGEQNSRFPVVLLLDGVVDTGNMGAIIRSAYFLGIDAIVFAGRNSAPLSPVTIKTSAGAAENMPLLHVKNEVDFIQRSQKNGWRFYAADAPSPGATYLDRLSADTKQDDSSLPVLQSPSVLMMGSEGSGLASHIKSHADAVVSIPGARHSIELGVKSDPARIDSLNVSVAAALLMEMFLRTPLGLSQPIQKGRGKMW